MSNNGLQLTYNSWKKLIDFEFSLEILMSQIQDVHETLSKYHAKTYTLYTVSL